MAWQLVGRGVGLALVGTAAGSLTVAGLTRFLETLLFGIEPTDLPTFVAMAALLLVIAALASWGPARSAMQVDPVQALKMQ